MAASDLSGFLPFHSGQNIQTVPQDGFQGWLLGKAVSNCMDILENWEQGVWDISVGVSKPDLQSWANY